MLAILSTIQLIENTQQLSSGTPFLIESHCWWPSYQIRKTVGCACAGNAGNGSVFPGTDFKGNLWLANPACITARASRTCHDAYRDRLPAEAEKTLPAFPAHTSFRICQENHDTVVRMIIWNIYKAVDIWSHPNSSTATVYHQESLLCLHRLMLLSFLYRYDITMESASPIFASG